MQICSGRVVYSNAFAILSCSDFEIPNDVDAALHLPTLLIENQKNITQHNINNPLLINYVAFSI